MDAAFSQDIDIRGFPLIDKPIYGSKRIGIVPNRLTMYLAQRVLKLCVREEPFVVVTARVCKELSLLREEATNEGSQITRLGK